MEYNNDTVKKLYYGDSLVNIAVTTGGNGLPANLSSWTYDDYGSPITLIVKNGVTSIPSLWQYGNKSLTSIAIPNSVTTFGDSALSNIGKSGNYADISNIDFSSATTIGTSLFMNSNITGSITIPYNILSGATSGYSATNCYQMFYNAVASGLTINVYANGVVIPRYCFSFSSSMTYSDGLNITIYGTPTFLSYSCFACSTGGTVTFADCTTPPNYDTSSTYANPFNSFKGTLYVPSAGLTAWKNKYTNIKDQIKAIGT